MRTFIALELPTEFADDVAAMARTMQNALDGRFMQRDSYHLTLAFLGDIDEHTSRDVIAILDGVCTKHTPPLLSCDGLGTFGKPFDCTLWLSLAPNESLTSLTQDIRSALKAQGISLDSKPFKPHITLARRADTKNASLSNLPFPYPTTADRVTLFKSTLDREGATYKPLYTKILTQETPTA